MILYIIFYSAFLVLLNCYFAFLIKDGYDQIVGKDLNLTKKILLLIPPVSIFVFIYVLFYTLFWNIVDKFKNYF